VFFLNVCYYALCVVFSSFSFFLYHRFMEHRIIEMFAPARSPAGHRGTMFVLSGSFAVHPPA
jgi:hypothetical protein